MKYLFVGDVHNHKYMFDDIKRLDQENDFDRIIFMGDYVDDWHTTNHNSLETLDIVVNLKRENWGKYTFLWGNHESSYTGYKCSGHQYELDDVMRIKLEEYIDFFDLYTSVMCGDKEYICTHAGITNAYIQEVLHNNWRETLDNMNKNKLSNLDMFALVSYLRGGNDDFSSPIWTDLREHKYFYLQKPIIPYQIVGHTPVKTIINENGIYFIDTHSTYPSGENFGDKSYLVWNENKFDVKY